jgi:hypothetical protein
VPCGFFFSFLVVFQPICVYCVCVCVCVCVWVYTCVQNVSQRSVNNFGVSFAQHKMHKSSYEHGSSKASSSNSALQVLRMVIISDDVPTFHCCGLILSAPYRRFKPLCRHFLGLLDGRSDHAMLVSSLDNTEKRDETIMPWAELKSPRTQFSCNVACSHTCVTQHGHRDRLTLNYVIIMKTTSSQYRRESGLLCIVHEDTPQRSPSCLSSAVTELGVVLN